MDQKCVLCQSLVEFGDHLFLICPYSTDLREQTLTWIKEDHPRMQNWDQYLQWIVSKAKGKSCRANIFRMVTAELCYTLWLKRNSRIFENTFRSSDTLVRELAYICNVRGTPKVRQQLNQFLL